MGWSRTRADKVSGAGFSLIELLVVIAIISILMGMYMSTLGKALLKAKKVAAAESFRQEQIGRMADGANAPNGHAAAANKEACRKAFRHTEQTSEGDIQVTEVLYAVKNEDEFRAYWHTMINADNTSEPEYAKDGSLRAFDEDGNEFMLSPMDQNGWSAMNVGGQSFPVMWEFLSTRVADTTTTGLGVNVLYSDGRVEYLRYPAAYPSTPTVAELSRRFYAGS